MWKITVVLLLVGEILLTACGATSGSSSVIQAVPTCISATPEANIYRYPPKDTIVNSIFFEGQNNLMYARKRALFYLGEYVSHSSDFVNIVTDDGDIVRITVVYISPSMVQFVFLNHALYTNNLFINFNDELRKRLAKLGDREEMIFFVVITLPEYNENLKENASLLLNIPIEQMVLRNSADLAVLSTHDDHILDEPIPIIRKPISGYVAFPLSLMQGDSCQWIMNPKWNTTMTLDIPWISLNGRDYGTKFWSVQYNPLLNPLEGSPWLQKEAEVINRMDNTSLNPLDEPPLIEVNETRIKQEPYWDMYWQDMGRYIWYKIMLENYP